MLMRVWLYACKLALLGFTVMIGGLILVIRTGSMVVVDVGFAIVTPIGIAGGLLGVWFFLLRRRTDCPLCGRPSWPTFYGRHSLAVDCEACGVVCANVVRDFRFKVCEGRG